MASFVVLGPYAGATRIQGDDAGRVSKQRIDVQLSDLRVIGSQLAEANQYFGDSLDFCGWLATISLQ